MSWNERERSKFLTRSARNERLLCNARGCTRRRYRVSRYCQTHAQRMAEFGSLTGRRILPKEYAYEKQQVERFLSRHRDHVATQTALKLIDRWLAAAEGPYVNERHYVIHIPGRLELQRLLAGGVEPWELLVEAATVFVYTQEHGVGTDTGEELARTIGTSVIYLRPLERRASGTLKRPSGAPRREIGQYLLESLRRFFVNILMGVRAERQAVIDEAEKLAEPF
jgi:hypothetical protein